MKWIQVMIFQWSNSVELNVNDEICQIAGQRMLSRSLIKKFQITNDFDGNSLWLHQYIEKRGSLINYLDNKKFSNLSFPDVVQPPVSPITQQGIALNHPYILLFVAGVPTEIHFGNLEPIYRSTIPNLLGCMRGLMIGRELIDMHNQSYWSYYPNKPG